MSRSPSPTHSLEALLASSVVSVIRQACGPKACLVGGVVRDALLGRAAADVDVVVSGRGRVIAQRLAEAFAARLVDLGGERFASYRLVARDRVVDLWDRGGQSLEDDLRRRDFTLNSIALQLGSGSLIDPFGGHRDIDRRLLRATTRNSFSDDPQRVLRLVRFATSLEFEIEPETLELARRAAPAVATVAIERIRTEVEALIRHPGRLEAMRRLSRLSLYPGLWRPPSYSTPTDGATGVKRPAESLAELESWSREIGTATSDLGTEIDRYLTSMALLYLEANRQTTAVASGSGGAAVAVAGSDLLTRRQRKLVARLVDPLPPGDSPQAARWFLHRWGSHWLDALALWGAGARSRSDLDHRRALLHRLATLAREHGEEIFDPAPLLNGAEVGRLLSIEPGPEVGRCLNALRRHQIEGGVAGRSEALAFVADWELARES